MKVDDETLKATLEGGSYSPSRLRTRLIPMPRRSLRQAVWLSSPEKGAEEAEGGGKERGRCHGGSWEKEKKTAPLDVGPFPPSFFLFSHLNNEKKLKQNRARNHGLGPLGPLWRHLPPRQLHLRADW